MIKSLFLNKCNIILHCLLHKWYTYIRTKKTAILYLFLLTKRVIKNISLCKLSHFSNPSSTHEWVPHSIYYVFQFIYLNRFYKNHVRTNHDQKQTSMHLYRLESNTVINFSNMVMYVNQNYFIIESVCQIGIIRIKTLFNHN